MWRLAAGMRDVMRGLVKVQMVCGFAVMRFVLRGRIRMSRREYSFLCYFVYFLVCAFVNLFVLFLGFCLVFFSI